MNMIGGVVGAVSTVVLGWFVFCGLGGLVIGLGTQRLPDPNKAQGDDVSSVFQFIGAYISRGSGDAAKTFMRGENRGPIAGANGDTSPQALPIDDRQTGNSVTPGDAPTVKAVGADMGGDNALMGDGGELSLQELKAQQARQGQ